MKTHLVGDDCKPLLIKAGEDVTVPLVTLEQQKKEEKLKWVHFKIQKYVHPVFYLLHLVQLLKCDELMKFFRSILSNKAMY